MTQIVTKRSPGGPPAALPAPEAVTVTISTAARHPKAAKPMNTRSSVNKSDSHDPLLTPFSDTSHHMPGYDKLANHIYNYRYLINCSPLSAEKWYNFFVPIFWSISLSITQH